MKYLITKEEFDALSDVLKGEYAETNGVFNLKLEGHENAFVPKEKKDLAEQHRREAEKKLAEVEKREAELAEKLKNASGKDEIEKIRQQHQTELERIKGEYQKEKEAQKAEQAKTLIQSAAKDFASEKFTIPSLVARSYQDRLTVEEVNGEQVLRVLEPDGKPSIKSVSDLQKEFLENKEFASIIKASSGSGGGATPPGKGGGGATPGNVDLLTANPKQATEAIRAKIAAGG